MPPRRSALPPLSPLQSAQTDHSEIQGPSSAASPTSASSHTLSNPGSPTQSYNTTQNTAQTSSKPVAQDTKLIAYKSDLLAQYQHEIMQSSTYCDFDFSGEDLSGSEYKEHREKRVARAHEHERRREREGEEKEESIYYGNLPLIDIWIAKSKGWDQERVSRMEGFGGGKEEDEELGKEGEGDDGGKGSEVNEILVPVLCDGNGTYGFMCGWEVEGGIAMPLPAQDDPDL